MIELRGPRFSRIALAAFVCALATPAFAVNKDMVQLQTEVADLQTAVAHLQQSNDERMGVLRDLVQQTADSVNKMSVAVDTLQQQMRTQQEAATGKLDQVSGQVQSLNDSLDEVKARLNSMEKALQGVQNQQQSINAALQNLAPAAGSAPGSAAPFSSAPGSAPGSVPMDTGASTQPGPDQSAGMPPTAPTGTKPSADVPFPATQGPYANGGAGSAAPLAPAVADLYRTALGDYEAAKYQLATQEFTQVIRSYPSDPLAGNSFYYIGEIDYRAGRYSAAIKDYDHVLEQYPGNPQTRVAELHKAMALLSIKEREAGIAEFRALIQRYPNSPEAAQARSKLNGMGVRPTAPHDE
jgi:TolA-binding protein